MKDTNTAEKLGYLELDKAAAILVTLNRKPIADGLELLERLHLYSIQVPPVLYHYTSMQALLSIAESGRIRATHVRFLNDQSEITTMWDLVIRRLGERIDAAQSTQEKESLSEIVLLAQSRPVLNEFVASFSEKKDDLSQWRSYCPEGVGFSIGFSSSALRSQWVSDPHGGEPSFVGTKLVKVQYVDGNNTAPIDSAIDAVMSISAGMEKSLGGVSKHDLIVGWLSTLAPSFKHSAFRDESEWRLVLTKFYKPMPGQRFRVGKSTVVPFVEVELNKDLNKKPMDACMIREVVVGPTPNVDLAMEAVRFLFQSSDCNEVVVERSGIPYRHW